jgi:hypothetical protein
MRNNMQQLTGVAVLLALWISGCTSSRQPDLAAEGPAAAAPQSPANEINRANFSGQPAGAAREPAQQLLAHGPYRAEVLDLPGLAQVRAAVVYRHDARRPMPIIVSFMPGSLNQAMEASAKLTQAGDGPLTVDVPLVEDLYRDVVDRGIMVAAITARDIPWPAGRPRWIWPTPDAAGAHFFATWGRIAPFDFGTLLDVLEERPDVRPDRVGYFGFSTTALIGYALVANESRINVAVLNGGAGDLGQFAAGWSRNYDWASKGIELWPETVRELELHNPLLRVDRIAPKAILMMNGGEDRIIPIEAARSFHTALRPHYRTYDGWKSILLEWLDRYLIGE